MSRKLAAELAVAAVVKPATGFGRLRPPAELGEAEAVERHRAYSRRHRPCAAALRLLPWSSLSFCPSGLRHAGAG